MASFLAKDRSRSLGYIDTTGTVVISPQFAQAGDFHEGLAVVDVFNAGQGKQDFAKPQQFGFITREGSLAVPALFRALADRFSEGLAAVRTAEESMYGYIDPAGQIVIPPIACRLALPFTDGLARIQGPHGEEVGYINRRGEFVWPMRT